MKVIALGDIADKFLMDDLPAQGIVIEATKEELQNLPSILYRDIEVTEKKPPRNCDVGTPDEWYERHNRWCAKEWEKDCAVTTCRQCFAEFLNNPTRNNRKEKRNEQGTPETVVRIA